MYNQRIIKTLIAIVFTAVGAQAATVPLLEGYGDTKWGQSKDEVMAAVAAMPDLQDIGGSLYVLRQDGEAGDVVQKIEYTLGEDTLYMVVVYLKMPGAPAAGLDEDGLAFVKAQLDAKYEENQKTLRSAGIRVRADHGTRPAAVDADPIAARQPPVPSGLIRVIYHNALIQNLSISKRHAAAMKKAEQERAEARAAKEKELRENPRYKAMSKTGIGDRL